MSAPIHFKTAEEQAAEGYEPLPNSGSTTGQPSVMQEGFNPSSASDSQFSQGGFRSAADSGDGVSQQGKTPTSESETPLQSSHMLTQPSPGFQTTSSTGGDQYSSQSGYQDPSATTGDQSFSQTGFQNSSTGGSDDFSTSGGRTSETGPSATRGENFGGGVSGETAEDTSGAQFSQGGNQDTSGSDFSQGGFQDASDLTSRPDSNTLTAGKADQTFSESGTQRSGYDTTGTSSGLGATSGTGATTSGMSGGDAVGDYTQGGFNDDSGVGKKGNFGHFEEGGR
ncbi:hypothetical protein MMC18_003550 [Xylographa bjoerkii]|nr:hypothetical protein [Xylographa bjoerkii]